jgi:hypothetical protein
MRNHNFHIPNTIGGNGIDRPEKKLKARGVDRLMVLDEVFGAIAKVDWTLAENSRLPIVELPAEADEVGA